MLGIQNELQEQQRIIALYTHTVLGEHVWYRYNRITAKLPAKMVKITIKKITSIKIKL